MIYLVWLMFLGAFFALALGRWRSLPLTVFLIQMVIGVVFRCMYVSGDQRTYLAFWQVVQRRAPDIDFLMIDLLFAMMAVVVGYAITSDRWAEKAAERSFGMVIPRPAAIPWNVMAILAGICVIGFAVLVEHQFGNLMMGLSILSRRVAVGGISTFAKLLLYIGCSFATLAIFKTAHEHRSFSWRGLVNLLTGAALLYLMFRTGGRGSTITFLITFGIAQLWGSRPTGKIAFKHAALLGAVGVALVIGGYASRLQARGTPFADAVATATQSSIGVFSGAVPTLDLYAGAKEFAGDRGFDYGKQYAGYVLRLVPRAIWPNKPTTLNTQLRQYYYGDSLSGVPPTLFGEFYIALGVIGLLAGSVAFGAGLRVLTASQHLVPKRPEFAVLFGYLLTVMTFTLVRNGLEVSIFQMLYFLAPLILLKVMSGKAAEPARRQRFATT